MAEDDALVGSMRDSTILVRVMSLLAGRKFFTPEMRFSNWLPRAPSLNRSVSLLLSELKPRKSSVPADGGGGAVGAELIIVMRVISRTLKVD